MSRMLARARHAIRAHVDSEIIGDDPTLRRLINCATYDLYYGPTGATEPDGDGWIYPGFEAALDAIRDSVLADVGDLYYLTDCETVADCEPDGWTDDDGGYNEPEEYVAFSRRDVLAAYMGTLSEYL